MFAACIHALRAATPGIVVEVLTPDFQGRRDQVETVLAACPEVFSHNLETVKRLQAVIRPQASYGHSLAVLQQASESSWGSAVKSGLMLGLGETDDEVVEALRDLHAAGVRLLTLGQYLQPTRAHREVQRYVTPADFDRLGAIARDIGFKGVASGPLVRSSYRADELLALARTGGAPALVP
jgi:lipoic acid synthetase